MEKLLAQATPEEEEVLEAGLPELLQLRSQRRQARDHLRDAFSGKEHLRKQQRLIERLYPAVSANPNQQRRVNAVRELHAEAHQPFREASSAFETADLMYRHARGLPLPRRSSDAKRRYKLAPGRKRFRRRWERVRARKPVSDLRKGFKQPPRWRDLCPGSIVYMLVAGAYAHGRVIAYTLNLNHAVEAKARSQKFPAAWLRDRIARRVQQKLGRPVEILTCLESHKSGRLHAHGVMAGASLSEEGGVQEALQLAGGQDYGSRQVRINTNRPDSGWASYMAKDFDQFFEWPRFAATRALSVRPIRAREVEWPGLR